MLVNESDEQLSGGVIKRLDESNRMGDVARVVSFTSVQFMADVDGKAFVVVIDGGMMKFGLLNEGDSLIDAEGGCSAQKSEFNSVSLEKKSSKIIKI